MPNYVFYASTLYPNFPVYNLMRATFIEACLATPGLRFEGGLVRKDNFRVPEFSHITITKYYSPAAWLEKVQASALGFWAPGDQGAMTLKLAEFMACGKAIIAVPIRQEQLPAPVVHGEHVHFVDGSLESIKTAVKLLTTDHEYRQKLERNARSYYEEWVAPERVVRRFIREACQRAGVVSEI
jgi:glycosyltransferase involved in cell wall biosynthesis